jgi:hypothetical protein
MIGDEVPVKPHAALQLKCPSNTLQHLTFLCDCLLLPLQHLVLHFSGKLRQQQRAASL